MQFACPQCGSQVVDGQCEACHEVYIMVCPQCGNSLVFEEVAVGPEVMHHCLVCDNETDLQMVALV